MYFYNILIQIFLVLALTTADYLQTFKAGNHRFSTKIYQETTKIENGNFLISPFSIEVVLALVQVGARGESAKELQKGLFLPETTKETITVIKTVLSNLNNEYYNLTSANNIYVQNDFKISQNFKEIATNNFDANIEAIDFTANKEAANKINSWVEDHTNKKITNIVNPDDLKDDIKLFLVNALYFAAKWEHQFEEYETHKADFHKTSKDVVSIETMHENLHVNLYKNDQLNLTYINLPYLGGKAALTIVLPDEIEGLKNVEDNLDNILTSFISYNKTYLRLHLPKFTIESKINLNDILDNLGIKTIFTKNANLTGIGEQEEALYVSKVLQKTFINVTETGTEAAAATTISFVPLSLPNTPRLELKVDHPFLFYITVDGLVLFIGKFVGV